MNTDESLALHARGREAWNAWAEKMLAERAELEKSGRWSKETDNKEAQTLIKTAEANFFGHKFEDVADFSGFVFPGSANFFNAAFSDHANFDSARFSGKAWFGDATFSESVFHNATFSDEAWFNKASFSDTADFYEAKFFQNVRFDDATFSGDAWFDNAEFTRSVLFHKVMFSGDASFSRVNFSGNARFDKATFSSDARFEDVKFSDRVRFDAAIFRSYADFAYAIFINHANFSAIRGEGFFTLYGVTFHRVPDFSQAHFTEAPQFDNATFPPSKSAKGDKGDLSARWRALKRLAVQGYDHEREQFFFAEEIKSLRGVQDKLLPNLLSLFREGKPVWPGGGRYWGGLFYQVFSNFGRSMLRPLAGWAGAVLGFAFYYLSSHFAAHNPAYPAGTLGWAWRAHSKLTCVAGQGEPVASAFYLAVHKGSIFAGLGGSEKLVQAYTCLYGEYGGDRHIPIIPDAVVYAGIGQTVFSAVMIFLFLLAVRNHFRIK